MFPIDRCTAAPSVPAQKAAPSTVGGLGGVANVAGAEFSPRHLLGGRFPGEQVIKLSEAPFVPNVGSVRCQLDVTEALLFWAANSARKGRR